jgi:Protein of unknown function (DUF2752)
MDASTLKGAILDLRELRWIGLGMLGAGFLLPAAGHPGFACPLRTLTGIPCPLCGMSTSVEDTVHLHVGDAMAVNPGGIVLVLAALTLLAVRSTRRLRVPWPIFVTLLAASWVFELFRFSVV